MSSHKPGNLKQSNKKHKGSAGKRAQNRSFGEGRISSQQTQKTAPNRSNNPSNYRLNRINRNNQLKKQKNAAVWLQKRLGSAQNSSKVISIIALSDIVDINSCIELALQQTSWSCNNDSIANSTIINAFYSTHKAKLTFLKGQSRDIFNSVEVAKLADLIMFVVHASEDGMELIDQLGLETLSAIKALGCPEIIVAAAGLDGTTSKSNLSLKKAVQQYLDTNMMIPDVKLVECQSIVNFQRTLCNTTPKSVSWRSTRSYVLSDQIIIEKYADSSDSKYRVLVSGSLRGVPMNVHSLMHIMDVGTARLSAVWGSSVEELQQQQRSQNKSVGQHKRLQCSQSIIIPTDAILSDISKQDSLVMEASADTLMGEQTWPTDAELADFDPAMDNIDMTAGRNRRAAAGNIPKGMSSYQADWFQDEDGNADFNAPVIDDGDNKFEDDEEDFTEKEQQELLDEVNSSAEDILAKQRMRAAAAQGDKEFPDEVDTPGDVSARQRFARYRALQSFRASPWHPKENLPQDYARIFQFENFMGSQKRVLADCKTVEFMHDKSDLHDRNQIRKLKSSSASVAPSNDEEMECSDDEGDETNDIMDEQEQQPESHLTVAGAEDFLKPGQFFHFLLEDVNEDVVKKYQQCGYLALFNLFQHENKMSVLHFNVQRLPGHDDMIIKSKDSLLFQTGFRAYMTKPIISESNLNCDKHKMERYLLSDRFSMASCFGPISYSPCPLLVFKQNPDTSRFVLVATGSLYSVDPDRIMLKRIILTGLPIRVRKKMGVVKHMFFDSQDVRWFKPAELSTKFGLRGHIKEPIGTHGLLKAYFSAPIKQNDTVMLVLYKRVYPKFPEGGLIVK